MFFRQLSTLNYVKRTTGLDVIVNKLSFNCNKTNFMLLNCQIRDPTSFEVIINDHSIYPKDNLIYPVLQP